MNVLLQDLTPFALDWELAQLPDYSAGDALNPFTTFSAIPARARYQFMLDSAQYFVMTFIRGPVCRGQVATDVIDDQFYVLFQDPDADLSVTDPAYLASVQPYLELTPENEMLVALAPDWEWRKHERDEYIILRGKAYRDLQPAGPSLQDIWDGDGTNTNAALTVFRNFDNATVVKGFVGAIPKTLWVMDYPMLERTYYELVVNFNVFGTAAHQAETRLYFDLIRSGGENNCLHFMPPRDAHRHAQFLVSGTQGGKETPRRLCHCQRGPAGADTLSQHGPEGRVRRARQRAPQVAGRAA